MSPVTSEPIRFVYSFFLNNFGPTETVSGPDIRLVCGGLQSRTCVFHNENTFLHFRKLVPTSHKIIVHKKYNKKIYGDNNK